MKAQRTCSFKPSQKWNWVNFLFLILFGTAAFAEAPSFRLHTFREPETLNPLKQKNSNAGYITQQLYLSPLRWKDGKVSAGFLEKCTSKDLKVWNCPFKKGLKFSDGSPLGPDQFVQHLKTALDKKVLAPLAPDLFVIQGARELFEQKPDAELKVLAKKDSVVFRLKQPDFEFPLRLINAHLSPFKQTEDGKVIGTGPYQFDFWNKGERIRLKPNPHFVGGHKDRPSIEFVFQAEDNVALKLYENKELSFLRRLPTLYFEKYKDSPDLHKLDQIRFDYFGFGKVFWKDEATLPARRFISENLPYSDMGKLLASKPRPGCFGLPVSWSGKSVCYPEGKAIPDPKLLPSMAFSFSQNVDDNKRVFEWLQNSLSAKWNWKLSLDGLENKTFLDKMEQRQLKFFRKGMAPDRPSCASLLENFVSGAPENFIDLDDQKFNGIVEKLRTESKEKKRTELCRQGLETLRDLFVIIPTGPIYFTVLARPEWIGWSLNEINGLDLSQLHLKTKTSTKE